MAMYSTYFVQHKCICCARLVHGTSNAERERVLCDKCIKLKKEDKVD